ncbi:Predicted arabinose efflux permease, MFS family [Pseudomonas sp. 43mfcvi1.1]|uniref:MFS transporter n=1 Tax=unclassified Pseudomonas TaxID=196821 RepID=UPI000D6B2F77|nr:MULTISPECIES: MFS transporter [unclassified Pseudomonas]PWJ38998.1 putative MFS family arabinose efflux permease [Pseudomonas sp. 43mfcvi1.1]BBH34045.1 transporter membrane protein [Pseudomonas sp. St290]SSB96262.1 Predicted arabinose efflux permease, MFS family [Pseudomonas sp. 43mfcvi1.1]
MTHTRFFGKTVLTCTFILAIIGWGVGFYGPPIYMQAVMERTGWPIAQVSTAVTLHFLSGTIVIANLPRLYARFGIPAITLLGSIVLGIGVNIWAQADQLWVLYAGAVCSGIGWVTLGAAAVNTLIAPWYVKDRPKALGKAYNGASLGGVIFSPLWVLLIERFGFAMAALVISVIAVLLIGALAFLVFSKSPQSLGQHPDNADQPEPLPISASATPWSTMQTLRSARFRTLAAGMSLGLFAQIGLIAHLYSILVGRMGAHDASFAMGLATASAMGGRYVAARLMIQGMNRRQLACLGYAIQVLGTLMLLGLDLHPTVAWIAVALIGSGIGNATSLPPLIAQAEFSREQTARVIALMVAISQATYAFAPAFFGLLRSAFTDQNHAIGAVVTGAVVVQVLAILSFYRGVSARPFKKTAY